MSSHFMEVQENISGKKVVFSHLENKRYLALDKEYLLGDKFLLEELINNEHLSPTIKLWAYHKIKIIDIFLQNN